jgi:hypothetical protein
LSYRAPTWSWFSLDPVYGRFVVAEFLPHYDRLVKSRAKIIQAECTPAGQDPTGAIASGFVVLSGLLASGLTRHKDSIQYPENRLLCNKKLQFAVLWDIILKLRKVEKLYCFLIGESKEGEPKAFILQRCNNLSKGRLKSLFRSGFRDEEMTFERVGVLCDLIQHRRNWNHCQMDIFKNTQESIIKII